MGVKIIAFGMLADLLPKEGLIMESNTLKVLHQQLQKNYPELKNYTYRIAVNQQISEWDTTLKDEDIVALLPPFSGG